VTLVVETPNGTFLRQVPSASPLPDDLDTGLGAEYATHRAAAIYGLPDFVFQAPPLHTGSGVREPGDGLVIVGDVGLVIQVKARERDAIKNEDRERGWIAKKTKQAIKQADGTIRRLTETTGMRLLSARGRWLDLDAARPSRWYSIVVLDHPNVPDGIVPAVGEAKNPAVVLVRRDWDFLFDQLRSTTAVVGYFDRITRVDAVPLGEESSRYYELAQADAGTAPDPHNPKLFGGKGRLVSAPLLPFAPADREHQPLLRMILEDVAIYAIPQASDEVSRLRVLALLDRLPVGQRPEMIRFLEDAFEKVRAADEGEVQWRLRQFAAGNDDDLLLAFGACNVYDDHTLDRFRDWVCLRHHQMRQALGNPDLSTAAVLLTPPESDKRPFETTVLAAQGDFELTDEEIEALGGVWGDGGEEVVR
jgi:hypothetical protein